MFIIFFLIKYLSKKNKFLNLKFLNFKLINTYNIIFKYFRFCMKLKFSP